MRESSGDPKSMCPVLRSRVRAGQSRLCHLLNYGPQRGSRAPASRKHPANVSCRYPVSVQPLRAWDDEVWVVREVSLGE